MAKSGKQLNKKNIKETAKHFAYLLSFGTYEYVTSNKNAKRFERDNAEIIEQRITFATQKEMDIHKAQNARKNETPVTPPTKKEAKRTEEELAKLEAVKQKIEEARPGACLQVHWKTSSKARSAGFCLRFLNSERKDDWKIKGDHFCIALRNYVEVFGPEENPVVNKALANLAFGKMRNPEEGPNSCIYNDWSPPDSTKVFRYDSFMIYGTFDIPVGAKVNIREQETEFIEYTCRELGQTILSIMKDMNFRECYKYAINKASQWDSIGHPTNPSKQFWRYADDAKVKTMQCENFNKHLVKDDATALVALLFATNLPGAKYKTSDDSTDDDSSSIGSNTDSGGSPPTKKHKTESASTGNNKRAASNEQDSDDNNSTGPVPVVTTNKKTPTSEQAASSDPSSETTTRHSVRTRKTPAHLKDGSDDTNE
jgi:hypothetical protein